MSGSVSSAYQRISSCVHVEFKLRMVDLKGAARQMTLNLGPETSDDFVDILVSECAATFRTVGTAFDVPVNASHPGTARIPIQLIEKFVSVSRTFTSKETTVLILGGLLKIGGWQTRNPEIVLGVIPDQMLDIPSDASFLDTLALAWSLTPDGLLEQGLTGRVVKAQRAKEDAIDRATRALEPLLVEREKIAALVEDHIAEAGKRLRTTLYGGSVGDALNGWKVVGEDQDEVATPEGYRIASVWPGTNDWDQAKATANAHKISATLELLVVLEQCVRAIEANGSGGPLINEARAALAKAAGRA